MAEKSNIIVNTFNGGMTLDFPESIQPRNTYRLAKNAVLSDRESIGITISNEESNEFSAAVGAAVVGHFFVEAHNFSVIFSIGDNIGVFDHDKEEYTHVASAGDFGCSWGFNSCEWIQAEYKFMQPCDEIFIYFSSNCTYYRVNISELMSSIRKAALISSIKAGGTSGCEYNCDYFKLFNCVCTPKFTADVAERGGHKLEGGVYKFAVQLEDEEGNTTNWSEVSQPIYIGSDSNQPGEITWASINLNLTGLDCRYDVANIAVINGVGHAEVVAAIPYSTDGITFTYYGQTGRTIDLEEIITKGKKYFRGRSLAQKDSRLYLYNIRQEKNPNMQRRVFESAKLEFITIKTNAKTAERNNIKSLQRGENYLFGIVYKYCDGTHSPVFLMSPKGSGGGESYATTSPEAAKGKEEQYKREEGNTRTGTRCTGGCCGGGYGNGGLSSSSPKKTPPSELSNTETGAEEAVNAWDTVLPDYENSARCNDCHPPVCCTTDDEGNITATVVPGFEDNCAGCKEDEEAIAADGPDLENAEVDQMDTITSWGYEGNFKPSSGNWIQAAKNLIEYVKQAEVIKREKATITVDTTGPGAGTGLDPEQTNNTDTPLPSSTPTNSQTGGGVAADNVDNITGDEVDGETPPIQSKPVPPPPPAEFPPAQTKTIAWGDEYHNIKGDSDLDGKIEIVGRWAPKVVTTIYKYPNTKDCEGLPIYGNEANQFVKLFRTPEGKDSPIVQATGKGVPNRFSPASEPYYMADPRHLGIEVTGVPLPDNDEDWFPKPLCPNEPYRIVMVERDQISSTVQANCLATSTFTGLSGGQTHYFPRHGLCSRDKCDFHVQNGDSHFGSSGGNVYNLYGLDTGLKAVGLSPKSLRLNALVNAMGHRYGLYAEGKKPNDRLAGNRIDQRGARQMLNANLFQPQGGDFEVSGISYAEANGVTPITGITHPCSTKYRESSVFVGLGGSLGEPEDASFKMDTFDHECPIWIAHGWNVSLVREIKDQYGSVPGMKFIDTGVKANGRTSDTRGFCGDVYIGPYSFVKKGYVSDKVGEIFGTKDRDRTVCDSPDDLLLQNLDINFYPTRFPKSGDKSDARNFAGGFLDFPALSVQGGNLDPVNDFYYPKVTKSVIVTWLESRNNPWKRATGIGDQVEAGLAYYPKLKGMHLDSYVARDLPWEESFANRFYYRVEQPSPAQLMRKAIIRNIMEIILPALGFLELSTKQLPTDITSYFYILPGLIAYWKLAKDVLTREDYLNKMVGISDCKIDSEGGEPDNHITNFEDNYHHINAQYQVITNENYYKTMPLNYNTCDCSRCLSGDTEILMGDLTRKKIQDVTVGECVMSYDFEESNYVEKKITKYWNRGEQEVYRLHFRNNTFVDATASHQWFVNTRRKKGVSVMTTKEILDSPKGKHSFIFANNIDTREEDWLTPDEAYILGIYIAEGHKYGTGVFITQFKKDTRDKIREHLQRTDFIWKEITNGFYISNLLAQYDTFFDCGQHAENKKIPEYVFSLGKESLRKLRDGLVDGDGTNLKSSIDKNGYNKAEIYYFYTSSHQLEKDFRLLGSIIDRPGTTYKNVRSGFGSTKVQCTTHCSAANRLREGKLFLKSVELLEDKVPTYDIEVEDTRAFILADSLAISHNCVDNETTNEIYMSNKQMSGSNLDMYKTFQSIPYNEIGGDKGKIRKLFKWNGNFYAHTTEGLFLIKTEAITMPTSKGLAMLMGSAHITDPSPLFEGVPEGMMGLQDPNASIITPFGYFFIDREAKRIYRFDGGRPEEISAKGMYNFFKDNLDFCNLGTCHDEKNEGSTYYSMGWDNRFNRLLVTKKSQSQGESFTASYYPQIKDGVWGSFHDYIPQSYTWDRNKLFSITDGKIYKHNVKNSYQRFFGKTVPFEVEFVANIDDYQWFTYTDSEMHTEATNTKLNIKGLDFTFDKIAAWNFTQGTGSLRLNLIGDDKDTVTDESDRIEEVGGQITMSMARRRYMFNNLEDLRIPNCGNKPMVLINDCQYYPKINQSIFDCEVKSNPLWMNKRIMDDHLIHRLTYNGKEEGIRLRLIDFKTRYERAVQ